MVEPVHNKHNKIYGIRFRFEGQTFKASEIGKEFGLRSLFLHYGQNNIGNTARQSILRRCRQTRSKSKTNQQQALSAACLTCHCRGGIATTNDEEKEETAGDEDDAALNYVSTTVNQ